MPQKSLVGCNSHTSTNQEDRTRLAPLPGATPRRSLSLRWHLTPQGFCRIPHNTVPMQMKVFCNVEPRRQTRALVATLVQPKGAGPQQRHQSSAMSLYETVKPHQG